MPTRIRTEAARVALANREHDQAMADIERRIVARVAQLKADPRATDKEALMRLFVEDTTMRKLVLEKVTTQVWRAANIETGAVATIEDDGQVRWTLPQYADRQ